MQRQATSGVKQVKEKMQSVGGFPEERGDCWRERWALERVFGDGYLGGSEVVIFKSY